ncbi:Uncharacterised protein [Klebsiella pneumoniae]|nr:Uncharacterised protein [Klebsiella pneumoniae]
MSFEIIAGLVVVILGLLLARSALVMLAGPVRRKPKLISNVPKRTPLLLSPRQNAVLKSRKGQAMYRKTLSVWAMTMLIASCAKSLPAPVVVDTACSWVRIIYLTDHDIDVLDKQTKRDILAHNKAVQANCSQLTEKGSR